MELVQIRNWRDMEKYGIDLLTGEACGLSYRGLFDLSKDGLEIVNRTIGAVEMQTPSDYNGGNAVGSLLMPYAMFEPLAVFALFMREKCQHVLISHQADTYTGIAIVGADKRESLEELVQVYGIEKYRILSYPTQQPGINVGMSNVHQMSGRVA